MAPEYEDEPDNDKAEAWLAAEEARLGAEWDAVPDKPSPR